MSNYRNIGKLVASFGLQGELVFQHHFGKKTSLKGLEIIFLEQRKEELLPYFIEQARIKTDTEIYLKLEGIGSKEEAKKVLQKEVWLAEEEFVKFAAKSAPISMVGYLLKEGNTVLGEILEVIEQPHQVLCRIELNGNEALIPINEETLLKMDKKNKIIMVSLPDGLLDIYR